jgi:hypothetical protein
MMETDPVSKSMCIRYIPHRMNCPTEYSNDVPAIVQDLYGIITTVALYYCMFLRDL